MRLRRRFRPCAPRPWSSRRGIQLLTAMFRVRVNRLLERLCYGRIKNRSKELNADFIFS
jgi:hypothetical protein